MVNFTIINADIEQDTVHPEEMTVIVNTKVVPVIMNGTKKLTAKDYQLEGEGLVNGKYAAATAEGNPNILTVKGAGSYAGSSFEIKVWVVEKSAAQKLAVAVDRNFKPVYTGSPLDLSGLLKKAQGGDGAITVTQLSHMGCPIAGDTKYNPNCNPHGSFWQNICLCACRLEFRHPQTRELLQFRLENAVI